MQSRVLPGLVAGACCAALIACAAGGMSKQAAVAPPSAGAADAMNASPERQEIARLDAEIDAELGKRNLPPAPLPACAGVGCVGAADTAQAMGVHPRTPADAQTCKPAASDTCKDSCTLSDSICTNASKICSLAKRLGDNDAWANEKCAKGTDSCTQSKKRCCDCL